MTNILKDVWEDRERGACWLPQEVFSPARRRAAAAAARARSRQASTPACIELVGRGARSPAQCAVVHPADTARARPASAASACGPSDWRVLTLRKIERTPGFTAGAQVKISHARGGDDAAVEQRRGAQRLAAAAPVRAGRRAGCRCASLAALPRPSAVRAHAGAARAGRLEPRGLCTRLSWTLRRVTGAPVIESHRPASRLGPRDAHPRTRRAAARRAAGARFVAGSRDRRCPRGAQRQAERARATGCSSSRPTARFPPNTS